MKVIVSIHFGNRNQANMQGYRKRMDNLSANIPGHEVIVYSPKTYEEVEALLANPETAPFDGVVFIDSGSSHLSEMKQLVERIKKHSLGQTCWMMAACATQGFGKVMTAEGCEHKEPITGAAATVIHLLKPKKE